MTFIGAAAGVTRALLGGRLTPAPLAMSSAASTLNPAREKKQRDPVEAELVTVGPDGFEPTAIRRPKGTFYLVIDNLSEVPELDLKLMREAGHNMREVRMPRGQADWAEPLDLPPGTYVLRESTRGWECHITVNP